MSDPKAEPEGQTVNLNSVKSPYLLAKNDMETAVDNVINTLWKELQFKDQVIKDLTGELAKYKDPLKKIPDLESKVTKTQPTVTVKDAKSPSVPTDTG